MRRLPSAKDVAKLTKPGRYAVGHGAYLQISEWETRAWVFRYIRQGRARHLGMGSATYVTLAEARDKAFEYRRLLAAGGDPLTQKRSAARERAVISARSKSFREVADQYIAAHEAGWRGDASRKQWVQSLGKHVYPVIGDVPIAAIGVAEILAVLDPMRDVSVTQKRVRNQIARVLDWAAARDLRSHDNPARRKLLSAARKKIVQHFTALDYRALPIFMQQLRQEPELSAKGLELMILCASRPNEALGAKWMEVNFDEALWMVPGERMKSGRPHRVPLSGRAVQLLGELHRDGEFIFPGTGRGGHLTRWATKYLLERMGHSEAATAHGFRASFKTWASEQTSYPRELIESCLAHVIGGAVEQAYSRGDMLAKRRQLMEAWSDYCDRVLHVEGDVVPIRAGGNP
jgi:integrase